MAKIGGGKFATQSARAIGATESCGLFAQEFAIASAHQGDAATHETNGGVADRRRLPWLGADARAAKNAFGDHAIGCASQMSIERPQRIDDARIQFCPRRALPLDVAQKPLRRRDSAGRQFVDRDDNGKRMPYGRGRRQPELMLIPSCSQDEMFAIACPTARAESRPIRRRESHSVGVCRWTCAEYNGACTPIWKPEEFGLIRAQRRIDREIATPSAARDRRSRCQEQLENEGRRNRRDIRDCAEDIPRPCRRSSNRSNRHMRSASANPYQTWMFPQ